jgi:DNA-binding transcriptional MerR regulator/methylmalonyl-CoA mutase cobalamin-binding subunit
MPTAFTQQEVERATGLSREVLRKWELRYHFPIPTRGPRGQRLYSSESVDQLALIARLMRQGVRPGGLVPLPMSALRELCELEESTLAQRVMHSVAKMLTCLKPGAEPRALQELLSKLVTDEGLSVFVEHYFPEFNLAVGLAWSNGELAVYAEHHYTECVRNVVSGALNQLPRAKGKRVLLTTPPEEVHGLGILGVQAILSMRGAECIVLGLQTPVPDVVDAANGFDVAVVAISISACITEPSARAYVIALRMQLPQSTVLWVGGMGAQCLEVNPLSSVKLFNSLVAVGDSWDALAK